MKTMNDLTTLYAEYEDALFRIAMLELEMEKNERMMEAIEAGKSDIDMRFIDDASKKAIVKVSEAIDRRLRRVYVHRFVKNTFPKMCVAAAIVIALLTVGTVGTLAVSRTMRMKVYELLIRVHDEYTELGLTQSEESAIDVPVDWTGAYYLSYIPEHFTLLEVDSAPKWCEVFYQNEAGKTLSFAEYGGDTQANINTEGAILEEIIINDKKALCADNGVFSYIAWSDNSRYFVVSIEGPHEMAHEIANRVIRID